MRIRYRDMHYLPPKRVSLALVWTCVTAMDGETAPIAIASLSGEAQWRALALSGAVPAKIPVAPLACFRDSSPRSSACGGSSTTSGRSSSIASARGRQRAAWYGHHALHHSPFYDHPSNHRQPRASTTASACGEQRISSGSTTTKAQQPSSSSQRCTRQEQWPTPLRRSPLEDLLRTPRRQQPGPADRTGGPSWSNGLDAFQSGGRATKDFGGGPTLAMATPRTKDFDDDDESEQGEGDDDNDNAMRHSSPSSSSTFNLFESCSCGPVTWISRLLRTPQRREKTEKNDSTSTPSTVSFLELARRGKEQAEAAGDPSSLPTCALMGWRQLYKHKLKGIRERADALGRTSAIISPSQLM